VAFLGPGPGGRRALAFAQPFQAVTLAAGGTARREPRTCWNGNDAKTCAGGHQRQGDRARDPGANARPFLAHQLFGAHPAPDPTPPLKALRQRRDVHDPVRSRGVPAISFHLIVLICSRFSRAPWRADRSDLARCCLNGTVGAGASARGIRHLATGTTHSPKPLTCLPCGRRLEMWRDLHHSLGRSVHSASRGAGRCPFDRPMASLQRGLAGDERVLWSWSTTREFNIVRAPFNDGA